MINNRYIEYNNNIIQLGKVKYLITRIISFLENFFINKFIRSLIQYNNDHKIQYYLGPLYKQIKTMIREPNDEIITFGGNLKLELQGVVVNERTGYLHIL